MARIAIAGAGSIGFFVGGLLQKANNQVIYLGRRHRLDEVVQHGLQLTDFTGMACEVSPLDITDDPLSLETADAVLVCVKSGATEEMAHQIAKHAARNCVVISLQNGIENAQILSGLLSGWDVRAAMVPFNVVPRDPGQFHRATSGEIVIQSGPGDWGRRLSCAGLPFVESNNITSVQWGKLLINLTNAVNALSGLPLLEMLHHRRWRQLMADQMTEALAVLTNAGIEVSSMAPVPMRFVPKILRLPTPIYKRIAAQMLTIDPEARTSMAYDVSAGRLTEVDQLQGAILALADARNMHVPTVAAIHRAVKRLEGRGPVTPSMTPDAIRAS